MSELTRRRLLLASASTAAVGLAGCSSIGDDPSGTPAGTETATPEETDTPTATEEPTTGETTDETETEETTSGEHHWHGRLMFEVNGERIDFSQPKYLEESTGNTTFHFHDDGHQYQWHNHDEAVTLADALDSLPDIEYEKEEGEAVLTVDETTYRASDSGTTLLFRQRTTDVDPETYELQDGDIIWVKVYTDGETETPHG